MAPDITSYLPLGSQQNQGNVVMLTPWNLLRLAAVLVPLTWVLVTIYRLTLHPLAKYPGPFLWKISQWPDGLTARTGRRHRVHYELHCKYGNIVRIGPNRLSFNTARAFHDTNTNRNANVVKSGFVGFGRKITHGPNLQQIAGKQEHAQRRKIISHAFTTSALNNGEQFMLKQIRKWTDALQRGSDKSTEGWSDTKDFGHWTNLLTLDIFGELCFGHEFGAIEKDDSPFIHSVLQGAILSTHVAYLPIAPLLVPILRTRGLLKFLSPKSYQYRWSLRNLLNGLVDRRQQAEIAAENGTAEVRKDFFHYVLKGRDDDGNMLPLMQYINEAVLLIAAGTDTTSTALAGVLYYLMRNPDKLEKLRAEVDSAFTNVEDIVTGPQLSSLTYLRACIEEGMRMTPPVLGSLTRQPLAGGAMVDGIHMPAGIDIEVPIYAMTHNSDYFPDHATYIPERWLVGSKTPNFEVTEELVSKQRNAFVPFSSGPRNCLGMRMAWMEMSIVLARLVFLFDFRIDTSKQVITPEFESQDFFISIKEGPYTQFKLRERAPKA